MSDYIKRKDACVRLWKQLRRLSDLIPMGKDAAGVAVRIIEDLPAIDVVEVVRCKDCKHCEQRRTANYQPFYYCLMQECSMKDTDYCSYGEKKEMQDD